MSYWEYGAQPRSRAVKRVLRALPSTPRCGYCGAPFGGLGGAIVRPLGYRPSRKNPNVCSLCVEMAPPGGMSLEIGVLFADLRGFTADSESRSAAETNAILRRFYAHAEQTFLPGALIDKLIGDEVMALYVPPILLPEATVLDDGVRSHVTRLMLDHARELLERVGYGSPNGPEFNVGIGIDFGEAFIGNIGDSAVRDFTAVGDVVNTASRLQGHALAGEVVLPARLARWSGHSMTEPETVHLKGKKDPFEIHRLSWFEASTG